MENNNVIVSLKGITKKFGDLVAVDNLSLDVFEKEFLCLLGPSGCGKTTTLRLIGGLEVPTNSGKIFIENKDVTYDPPNIRKTNMVFQDFALFPHMNLFQNVSFGLRMKRLPKDEIVDKTKKILELMKLSGFETRRPNELSGGQQQRVSLARTLIMEPSVLLLDEPLGSLDLQLRKEMQLELKKIQLKIGITFIFVTHDQEEAMALADRIVVMKDGGIIQIGTPREIYENPFNEDVMRFTGTNNVLECSVSKVDKAEVWVKFEDFLIKVKKINENIRINDKLIISIRPELIYLTISESSDFDNAVAGKIVGLRYQGASSFYEVKVSEDYNFNVLELSKGISKDQKSLRDFKINDRVYLNWNSENCGIVLKSSKKETIKNNLGEGK